jgi:hypothetical protein
MPDRLDQHSGRLVGLAGEAAGDEVGSEASAITSGWKGLSPVPPGDRAVSNLGSVVGEAGPWSCRQM